MWSSLLALALLCLTLAHTGLEVNAGAPLKVLGLFPHPGVSHFHFFHPIMRSLAEAGHDVSVVSHFPDKNPVARYKDYPLTGIEKLTNSVDLKMFEKRTFYSHFQEFFLLYDWGRQACNFTLRSNALQQILKRRQGYFDVIIMEQFNTDCMMGVAYQLQAPVIALSSCVMMPWHYERMGAPIIPSHIPNLFMAQSQDMNFAGRLANWFSFHALNWMYKLLSVPAADKLVQYKFGHTLPSVGELAKNTSLFFVNQHYSLSGPKPLPPNVIELGGIHIQQAKPLPADLQRILDNAEHGVILISWGSMIRANSLSSAKRDGIVRAAARLKQQIIWKWENETLPNKPANMHIMKWLPQRDILCHPNVKVFMSHGGLMGTSEAAYCGVPVVATPMYGDQFVNSAALVQRGMATILNYEDIGENSVMRALKKALDKKYYDAAKLVSHSYNHRPKQAIQTAIWWVEHIAHSHGDPLIQPSAVHMSRFVYYSLDCYVVVVLILAIVIGSWVSLIRRCCGSKTAAKPKKD
ncbi:2-hydroxyacylsphingosine 1-beta-galactosyltransferase [Drosophila guanche]|uniref:UDP-glucuronosyltransferase n=1 Tax=Drosophila guanche TaxID=7266 RepID=A0A3B0JEG0_DROGU|nr:2-hydroxyacylsphingosine 1-beta-galactosyltransferase [Drosophila guanche]XP_034125602.1 2-hydroxyacylsphingosine 1-beta-galactosyltransferase [Drosophila guanche]SPP79043.1 blast:2-hydroxyacylsphingosine 1-beta-galactosyltransferase [Drosophila guanche]